MFLAWCLEQSSVCPDPWEMAQGKHAQTRRKDEWKEGLRRARGGGVDASSRRSEDAVRGLHRCVLFPPEHAANTRFSVSRGDTATRKISKQQEEGEKKKRGRNSLRSLFPFFSFLFFFLPVTFPFSPHEVIFPVRLAAVTVSALTNMSIIGRDR